MVTMFFYRIFRRTPSASPPEKPKAVCPPPPPPPRAPTPEETRENEKTLSKKAATENIDDQPTHLTLTEIEEFPGDFIQSYHYTGGHRANLQTESAPALGQRSFSLRSFDFFCSLPPK